MAVKIPEFISLLRDIRDNMYISIKGWYEQVNIWQGQVSSNTIITQLNTDKVRNYSDGLKEISVLNPTINIPPKADGSAGDSAVSYDPVNNEFNFSVPTGSDGKNMAITYSVDTTVERDAITGADNGEICYVDETQLIYIYTNGVWGTGIELAPATTLISLSDTPIQYAGSRDNILTVNPAENGVNFSSLQDLGIVNRNLIINPDGNLSMMTVLDRSVFGADRDDWGNFNDGVTGTPILDNQSIIFDGSASVKKLQSVSAKTAYRLIITSTGIATSVLLDTGVLQVGINQNNRFYVTAGGVTTTVEDLDIQTDNEYHIVGNYKQISIIDAITKLTYQNKSIVTVDDTLGTDMVLGSGLVGNIKSLNLNVFIEFDGTTETAPYVRMTQEGDSNLLQLLDNSVTMRDGLSIVAMGIDGAEPLFTRNFTDFDMSKSDYMTNGLMCFSADVRNNDDTAVNLEVELIADNGKESIVSSFGTIVIQGNWKSVSRTKTIDPLPDGWFIDKDTKFSLRLRLPKNQTYNVVASAIKLEFGGKPTADSQAIPSLPLADALVIKEEMENGLDSKPTGDWTFDGTTLAITIG